MLIDIVLGIIIIAQIIISYLERKDFNDRLMARNFTEYKDSTIKEEPNKLPEVEEQLDIEDAKDLINE